MSQSKDFTFTTSRRDLIIGASALGLGAIGPTQAALAQNSGDVMPIRLAVDYGTKTFKVYPKAAIVSYPILFIRSAFGKAGSLGLYLEMEGPTEADMKALATEAHDDLSRQLAATGYEMIPGLDVARHPDIVAKGAVPGNGLWDSGVPDPYGQRGWYATSADAAPMFGRIGKLDVRSDFGLPWELRGVSRDLGAMIVMPKLLFDFSSAGVASASGRLGSTSWVGGNIQFKVKPQSISLFWTGGPRGPEYAATAFRTAERDFVSPWPLLGNVSTVNRPIPASAGRFNGRPRYDVFTVDMNNWREQVRAAYRGYHKSMMDVVIAARQR
jgi:hypothetical protein